MSFLSERINRIQPSATLEMTAKAAELRRLGKPVYNLSVGEPDFPTPQNIQNAGKFAIENGHTKYTPGSGTHDLKQAIITKLKRDNKLTYALNEVVVSCGGKHSLYNACQALFQKNDEVIIFSPYWVSFPDFVSVTGATPVFVSTDKTKQFEPNFKDLESKITSNTKGIIINSPSNPTGGVWSNEACLRVLEICKKRKDIWVFSDECYEQLTYDKPFQSVASLDLQNKNIITFQSCSKTYAMTGWRIGYIGGDARLVSAVAKLQGQSTSCPNSIAQYAAIEALTGDQSCVQKMRKIFLHRRNVILEKLNNIPNIVCDQPNGAFYVFPDFSYYMGSKTPNGKTISNANDLCSYILDLTGVVSVSGESFGAPGYIRFSYATSDEIINDSMDLVKNAIETLNF